MAESTRVSFLAHQAADLAGYIGAIKKRPDVFQFPVPGERPEVDEELAQLEDALGRALGMSHRLANAVYSR